ncbi:MAG: preprotein translocase subunit YajC [Nitrospirota bacterium]
MFADIVYAAGSGGQEAGGAAGFFVQMFPLILIFVIFYFLLIRPQQKKQRRHAEMLGNLKKGDKVVTSGGIYGTIEYLSQSTVTLKIADNVKVKMSRNAIAGLRAESEED